MSDENISGQYHILFTFGDIDLSMHVDKIDIINSMDTVYPIVIIQFRDDSQQITEEQLYGQQDCKLSIMMTTEDREILETTELDLLVIKPYVSYGAKADEPENQHPRSDYIKLICIPKKPFETMATTVNFLFPYDQPTLPIDAVEAIVKKFAPDAELDIKKQNHNPDKMYQLIVPPMSFTRSIAYIDYYYSIFKGALFYYCSWNNKFNIWDLSDQINQTEVYTVYFLSEGKKDNEIYKEISENPDTTFYTYTPFKSNYKGNQRKMIDGDTFIGISKPSDSLFHITTNTSKQVFDENAPHDGGEFLAHDELKKRVTVANTLYTGVEYSDNIVRTRMASKIAKMADFSFQMDRNLMIQNIMEVGIPIMLIPESMKYSAHAGKYIVSESHLRLDRTKQAHFSGLIDIKVVRANVVN
jgi:hypothetical protein